MNEKTQSTIARAEEQMKKTIAHLETELLKIRAGKANPQMLDGISVEYYEVLTPLNQVANVSTPDAHTLAIQPWEKMMLEPIEKAIQDANLGLNPQNDGTYIRISIPPLTEERRTDLARQAKAETENSKVSIRNSRREANDEIKKFQKEGLAEDEAKDAESKVQELTDTYNTKADKHLEVKEKEIMTI